MTTATESWRDGRGAGPFGPAEMSVQAIGTVRNDIGEPAYLHWREIPSEITVVEQWRPALLGLEDFSHAIVLFWMHQTEVCKVTHVPQGKYRSVPRVGMFACRCQYRPNPIAVTVVRLTSVSLDAGRVSVVGLDAINGTPVLDIKPFVPELDIADGEVRVPNWVHQLTY